MTTNIKKYVYASAVIFGAWFMFGQTGDASAAVQVNKPGCAYEQTNYTVSLSWTTPNTGSGYIVDISTSPDFYYVWNRTVASGNLLTNVPNGFTESPWDAASPNPTPGLGLVVNQTYYVRIYNYAGHDPNLSPGVAFTVGECAPPNSVAVSGLPSCVLSGSTYDNFSVSWAGGSNPAFGYYVDVSDNNFGRWWTKNVSSTSTTGRAGFNGYYGVSGALPALSPGTTYYVRVFNGEHSLTTTFSVPVCSALTCTGAYVDNFITYDETGTHTINVTGVSSQVTDVKFAIWSDVGGQDDLIWYYQASPFNPKPQNLGGGNWRLQNFNYGAHPGYGTVRVHVYMDSPMQSNVICDSADFQRQPRPATSAPVVSGAPLCSDASGYTVTLSWSGTGVQRQTAYPAYPPHNYTGYIVDVGLDSAFNNMWNKYLSYPAPSSTTAGTGFGPYQGVSGPLTLTPGTTYYLRIYNDTHSPVTTLNVPKCGSLNIEAELEGEWILYGPNGYTTSGSGSASLINIPVGDYTLAPQPNSPAGYHGTADPTTLIVP